jgi:multiple sugar transport system substrate-binding protein
MFMNGRWATPAPCQRRLHWDVVNAAGRARRPVNWLFWGAYVVNANTEHPEEAFELVTR